MEPKLSEFVKDKHFLIRFISETKKKEVLFALTARLLVITNFCLNLCNPLKIRGQRRKYPTNKIFKIKITTRTLPRNFFQLSLKNKRANIWKKNGSWRKKITQYPQYINMNLQHAFPKNYKTSSRQLPSKEPWGKKSAESSLSHIEFGQTSAVHILNEFTARRRKLRVIQRKKVVLKLKMTQRGIRR